MGMDVSPAMDQDALVALLDAALRAEARSEEPPEADRHGWLYGSLGYTEPDAHGWVAPILPQLWMPRALCFWRAAIWSGCAVSREQMRMPGYSLAPWPEIEKEIGAYLLAQPWLLQA